MVSINQDTPCGTHRAQKRYSPHCSDLKSNWTFAVYTYAGSLRCFGYQHVRQIASVLWSAKCMYNLRTVSLWIEWNDALPLPFNQVQPIFGGREKGGLVDKICSLIIGFTSALMSVEVVVATATNKKDTHKFRWDCAYANCLCADVVYFATVTQSFCGLTLALLGTQTNVFRVFTLLSQMEWAHHLIRITLFSFLFSFFFCVRLYFRGRTCQRPPLPLRTEPTNTFITPSWCVCLPLHRKGDIICVCARSWSLMLATLRVLHELDYLQILQSVCLLSG